MQKSTILNIIKVTVSNFIKLFSGVLVGFLLPKIIGVDDYGYYKTFTLYGTYVGLFQLGIIDGIYLKYAGKNIEELDKKQFRLFSFLLLIIQLVFSFFLCGVSLIVLNGEYKFIFISLAVYLILYNITGYYQYLSQITGRFNELSLRNIIQSILTIISIIVLSLLYKFDNYNVTYSIYIYIYIAIQFLLTMWYVYTYREITFGSRYKVSNCKPEIIELMRFGIPLMFTNLCFILLLNIDRQFVNVLFDNQTYAIYSFAYNMLSLITTVTSAIATVLYPTLKQKSEEEIVKKYDKLENIICVLVFFGILVYYPLVCFVSWFLPKYNDSLLIFRIILPGLSISSSISIVGHNFFKVCGKINIFFYISLMVIFVSFVLNLLAYILFRTTWAISAFSLIALIIWYLSIHLYLSKYYQIKWKKTFIYMLIMIISFFVVTTIERVFFGFIVQMMVTIVITVLFNINNIKKKFGKV